MRAPATADGDTAGAGVLREHAVDTMDKVDDVDGG
jgi:hypothetical protein